MAAHFLFTLSVIKRCNFRPIIWRRLQRFFLFKLLLLQFAYAPAKKMRDCKGNIPFCTGFPIGARSIPVGTRFCFAKSSVLYLCFRLTRERGGGGILCGVAECDNKRFFAAVGQADFVM